MKEITVTLRDCLSNWMGTWADILIDDKSRDTLAQFTEGFNALVNRDVPAIQQLFMDGFTSNLVPCNVMEQLDREFAGTQLRLPHGDSGFTLTIVMPEDVNGIVTKVTFDGSAINW